MAARTVVYTAIFGKRDTLRDPEYVPEDCDFVCFTDQSFSSSVWDVRRVEPECDEPVLSAKVYKVLPHRYFPDYEQSIWVDGNISVQGDVHALLNSALATTNFAAFDHTRNVDSRDCIYDEAEEVLELITQGRMKHVDPEVLREQVATYKRAGYPEHKGLITAMILLRKHNDPKVIETMEAWWREIERYTQRDQVSFNYVAWKHNLPITYIDADSRNNEFFIFHSHRRSLYERIRTRLMSLLSSGRRST